MSDKFLTTYYHRREDGTHAVICPVCGGVHVYNNTGMASCYQDVDANFSVIAPFTAWQHDQAEMVKEAAEALGI